MKEIYVLLETYYETCNVIGASTNRDRMASIEKELTDYDKTISELSYNHVDYQQCLIDWKRDHPIHKYNPDISYDYTGHYEILTAPLCDDITPSSIIVGDFSSTLKEKLTKALEIRKEWKKSNIEERKVIVDRAAEWFRKNFSKDYPNAIVDLKIWKDDDNDISSRKYRWGNNSELMNMSVIVCIHIQIDGKIDSASNLYTDIIYTEE